MEKLIGAEDLGTVDSLGRPLKSLAERSANIRARLAELEAFYAHVATLRPAEARKALKRRAAELDARARSRQQLEARA